MQSWRKFHTNPYLSSSDLTLRARRKTLLKWFLVETKPLLAARRYRNSALSLAGRGRQGTRGVVCIDLLAQSVKEVRRSHFAIGGITGCLLLEEGDQQWGFESPAKGSLD